MSQYRPLLSAMYPANGRSAYPKNSAPPAAILTDAALAPSVAINGPLMLAPPSYVTSPNRLTIPIVNTNVNAGDHLLMNLSPAARSQSFGVNCLRSYRPTFFSSSAAWATAFSKPSSPKCWCPRFSISSPMVENAVLAHKVFRWCDILSLLTPLPVFGPSTRDNGARGGSKSSL